MEAEKLGKLLRATRLTEVDGGGDIDINSLATSLLSPWETSSSESRGVDVACAIRLETAAYHEAMVDATHACEFQISMHKEAIKRYVDSGDFSMASSHDARMQEAKRLATIIRQLLQKNTGM